MLTTQQKISTPLLFISLLISCALLFPAVSLGATYLLSYLDISHHYSPFLLLSLLTAPLNHRLKPPAKLIHLLFISFMLLQLCSHLDSLRSSYGLGPLTVMLLLLFLCFFISHTPTAKSPVYFTGTLVIASLCILPTACFPPPLHFIALFVTLTAVFFAFTAAFFHRNSAPPLATLSLLIMTHIFLLWITPFALLLWNTNWDLTYFVLSIPLQLILLYPTYKLFSYVREHPRTTAPSIS